ncbi:hypothetical protein HQO42_05275 [Rhodococcus fascians]|nr:hypothetical protein [Rhodococcus fascians]MBY4236584.1 hypothetical protein [Rhodococcus fascians]MBY4252050.1 hypothetical protein [Rhodococcus fascians]MBY4267928.1 hypothetical protein [Rhodococcus fascians]
MKVGDSVRLAIDAFDRRETESAMLHACNAVDGTARKKFPKLGVAARFTKLLRDDYPIFGLMAVPGVNIAETRWPVEIQSYLGKDEWPDIAALIYVVHRCSHGHGDELPFEFRLVDEEISAISHIIVERGVVRLPWNTIFGLLAVAVVQEENGDQRVRDDQWLSWGVPTMRFEINDWWGRKDDFLAKLETQPRPSLTLNWAEWTESPPDLRKA